MDNSEHPQQIPVIIIGLNTGQENYEYSMRELAELVEANNMTVAQRLDQSLDRPNPATYFGTGKVDELKRVAAEKDVQVVVANDELSPSQLSNLASQTNTRVIDRTALIIEIFANRAQSREAKIQVQIAKLQYQLPRLQTADNVVLDQQSGGGGLANRGAGETKLEMDRRVITKQIAHLRHELAEIAKGEQTKRKQRDKTGIPTAALVGYTNAGKSTIMNRLVSQYGLAEHKQVFTKNMLFATLDTSVRQLNFPGNKRCLLSDTVGFVSKLPTHLVEAFKSTLAEAANADLLVEVIDYSDPHYQEMMTTTEQTLAQIGIKDKPLLYVFNKADQTDFDYPTMEGDDRLVISAFDDSSTKLLMKAIEKHLFKDYVTATMLVPFNAGQVVSYLNEHANILSTKYVSDGTELRLELPQEDFQRYQQYVVD